MGKSETQTLINQSQSQSSVGSTQSFIMDLLMMKYTGGEDYVIVFFSIISVLSFYPVVYVLFTVHKNRGFDIMTVATIILSQLMYKTTVGFDLTELFLTQDSWHKLLNISLLVHFCSLIIYLAKLPKHLQGYLLAFGTFLIVIMQEKDQYSYKYALIPILFNNLVLIVSQCLMQSSAYVNTRMVVYGAIWYILSIIAFIGAYHKVFDFFYIFQDLTIFSTGFSLFYSWQSYEKHDVTYSAFMLSQTTLYKGLLQRQPENENKNNDDTDDIKRLEQKAKRKKEKKKQEKKQMLLKKYENEDEESGTLLQDMSGSKDKENNGSGNFQDENSHEYNM